MIRRMLWLIVGAVLGVAGYRRVSRLARTVAVGGRRAAARARGEAGGSRMGGWAQRAALFARDVRDGMELYSDRHPGLTGRTLDHDHDRAYPRVDYAKEVR
jgi:hypothetical protein